MFNQSFQYLSNINTIFLNQSFIYEYQCLLMQVQEKKVQRLISNKYIFYKSINLLTLDFSFEQNPIRQCDLVFRFFQFNVHLNLKTDYSNDLFYDFCGKILIKKENGFNQNLKKCSSNSMFVDEGDIKSGDFYIHPFLKVISNVYYLICMSLLLIYFGPIFFLIFRG